MEFSEPVYNSGWFMSSEPPETAVAKSVLATVS